MSLWDLARFCVWYCWPAIASALTQHWFYNRSATFKRYNCPCLAQPPLWPETSEVNSCDFRSLAECNKTAKLTWLAFFHWPYRRTYWTDWRISYTPRWVSFSREQLQRLTYQGPQCMYYIYYNLCIVCDQQTLPAETACWPLRDHDKSLLPFAQQMRSTEFRQENLRNKDTIPRENF